VPYISLIESAISSSRARIDPKRNRVIDTIHLGGVFGDDVALDRTAVWVLIDDDSYTPEVLRIDPKTDAVVATIPLAYHNSHFIFAVAGSILADGHGTSGAIVGNTVLTRIDPVTNQITATRAFSAYVWPAAGDGRVWVATGRSLVRIDPKTDQTIGSPVRVSNTGDALAVGEGGVWFLKPQNRNRVFRYNFATGQIDISIALPTGTTPVTIAVAHGSVWVLNYERSLTRIMLGPP
jgi:hypothetical protein